MGSVGARNTEDTMNVPINEWGEMWDSYDHRVMDGDTIIGTIEDKYFYDREPDIRKITKSKALDELDAWKNDDGTYGAGDGDESIYVIYDDGRYFNLTDGEPHKRWSKQGIKGISISTADYEIAWGEEYDRRNREWTPIRTHEFDANGNVIEGYANSLSSSKISAEWIERIKTTHVWDEKLKRNRTVREVLRKSTKKQV